MNRKLRFYERFGVEEYYIYDPDHNAFAAHLREGDRLEPVAKPDGMTSPRLGVRFDRTADAFALIGPDGRRFLTYGELAEQRDALAESEERQRARADRLAERLRAMGVDPDELG
jgi:hypothetical protein